MCATTANRGAGSFFRRHAVELGLLLLVGVVGLFVYRQTVSVNEHLPMDLELVGERLAEEPDEPLMIPFDRVMPDPDEAPDPSLAEITPIPPREPSEHELVIFEHDDGLDEWTPIDRRDIREAEPRIYGGLGRSFAVRIRSFRVHQRRTPIIHTVGGSLPAQTRTPWLEFELIYEVGQTWLDEVSVDFHIQVHDRPRGGTPVLFSRPLSFRDVPRGTHRAVVYMHPSSFRRYGSAAHATALIGVDGREQEFITRPQRHDRWWEGHKRVKGMLFRARETPFGIGDGEEDDYAVW